jgi:eukaryotic-like serine/threonine-protein kinase
MPLTSETGPTTGAVLLHADSARRVTKPLDCFAEPAPIQRLGQWRLHSLLRDGAFTRTYRAGHFSVASDCPSNYFIKVLREEFLDDPVALARLHNEATVGRCVAHRHIVPVLTAHVHRQPHYIVQPMLNGVTVATLVREGRPLALPSALWIARQAAEGLAALHLCGYIHGDVKPDNWMLAANGHVTLIDLGSARRIHEESTLELHSLVGTPRYMAPELFAGHWPDPRSDIYSLGIALFEMLAGRVPLDAEDVETLSLKKRADTLPDVRSYVPQIPREVSELVRALTARDPLRRPQPLNEIVRLLMRLEIATLRYRLPAQIGM